MDLRQTMGRHKFGVDYPAFHQQNSMSICTAVRVPLATDVVFWGFDVDNKESFQKIKFCEIHPAKHLALSVDRNDTIVCWDVACRKRLMSTNITELVSTHQPNAHPHSASNNTGDAYPLPLMFQPKPRTLLQDARVYGRNMRVNRQQKSTAATLPRHGAGASHTLHKTAQSMLLDKEKEKMMHKHGDVIQVTFIGRDAIAPTISTGTQSSDPSGPNTSTELFAMHHTFHASRRIMVVCEACIVFGDIPPLHTHLAPPTHIRILTLLELQCKGKTIKSASFQHTNVLTIHTVDGQVRYWDCYHWRGMVTPPATPGTSAESRPVSVGRGERRGSGTPGLGDDSEDVTKPMPSIPISMGAPNTSTSTRKRRTSMFGGFGIGGGEIPATGAGGSVSSSGAGGRTTGANVSISLPGVGVYPLDLSLLPTPMLMNGHQKALRVTPLTHPRFNQPLTFATVVVSCKGCPTVAIVQVINTKNAHRNAAVYGGSGGGGAYDGNILAQESDELSSQCSHDTTNTHSTHTTTTTQVAAKGLPSHIVMTLLHSFSLAACLTSYASDVMVAIPAAAADEEDHVRSLVTAEMASGMKVYHAISYSQTAIGNSSVMHQQCSVVFGTSLGVVMVAIKDVLQPWDGAAALPAISHSSWADMFYSYRDGLLVSNHFTKSQPSTAAGGDVALTKTVKCFVSIVASEAAIALSDYSNSTIQASRQTSTSSISDITMSRKGSNASLTVGMPRYVSGGSEAVSTAPSTPTVPPSKRRQSVFGGYLGGNKAALEPVAPTSTSITSAFSYIHVASQTACPLVSVVGSLPSYYPSPTGRFLAICWHDTHVYVIIRLPRNVVSEPSDVNEGSAVGADANTCPTHTFDTPDSHPPQHPHSTTVIYRGECVSFGWVGCSMGEKISTQQPQQAQPTESFVILTPAMKLSCVGQKRNSKSRMSSLFGRKDKEKDVVLNSELVCGLIVTRGYADDEDVVNVPVTATETSVTTVAPVTIEPVVVDALDPVSVCEGDRSDSDAGDGDIAGPGDGSVSPYDDADVSAVDNADDAAVDSDDDNSDDDDDKCVVESTDEHNHKDNLQIVKDKNSITDGSTVVEAVNANADVHQSPASLFTPVKHNCITSTVTFSVAALPSNVGVPTLIHGGPLVCITTVAANPATSASVGGSGVSSDPATLSQESYKRHHSHGAAGRGDSAGVVSHWYAITQHNTALSTAADDVSLPKAEVADLNSARTVALAPVGVCLPSVSQVCWDFRHNSGLVAVVCDGYQGNISIMRLVVSKDSLQLTPVTTTCVFPNTPTTHVRGCSSKAVTMCWGPGGCLFVCSNQGACVMVCVGVTYGSGPIAVSKRSVEVIPLKACAPSCVAVCTHLVGYHQGCVVLAHTVAGIVGEGKVTVEYQKVPVTATPQAAVCLLCSMGCVSAALQHLTQVLLLTKQGGGNHHVIHKDINNCISTFIHRGYALTCWAHVNALSRRSRSRSQWEEASPFKSPNSTGWLMGSLAQYLQLYKVHANSITMTPAELLRLLWREEDNKVKLLVNSHDSDGTATRSMSVCMLSCIATLMTRLVIEANGNTTSS